MCPLSNRSPRFRLAGADDPHRNDAVRLLDADGEPSNLWTRVQIIVSSDRRAGLWEIMDVYNRCLVIECEDDEANSWREVQL